MIKLNGTGQCQWGWVFAGPLDDDVYDVASTGDGGVVASGRFASPLTFGGPEVRDPNITGQLFTVRLDSNGAFRWVATSGGKLAEWTTVGLTPTGFVVAGHFLGTSGFQPR